MSTVPSYTTRLDRGAYYRFMKHVRVEGECWIWTGPTMPNGYGKHRAYPGQRERAAHRILWEHHHGHEVPDGMQLDHLCRRRDCVNPTHFEAVTGSENTRRQDHAQRRKTACPKGHPYDEANTRITPSGRRACRACDRARRQHQS